MDSTATIGLHPSSRDCVCGRGVHLVKMLVQRVPEGSEFNKKIIL